MEILTIDMMPFWGWFVAAGLLIIFEILLPTYFFLWLSVASFFTGLVAWAFPGIELWLELSIFSSFSVASLYIGKFYKHKFTKRGVGSSSMLNNRLSTYTGRTVPLTKEVVNNYGEIRLDDMSWKVKTIEENLPVGTKVKIITAKGMMFIVETFKD